MLNTLAAVATIMGFVFYVFIEWPKIRNRWKEAYPAFEKILISMSIISAFSALIPFTLAVFTKGPLLLLYLSAGLTLFGISMLIGYWMESKTLAYRSTSTMKSIWLWIVMSFCVGVFSLVFSWFDLSK